MAQKIWIMTLGCPKNEVDSENLKYIMRQAGYGLAAAPDEADVVLINTCGFIADAKEESVAAIFEAVQLKKNRPEMKLAVTGCLAQRYGAQLEAEIPEIDCIAGVTAQAELPGLIAAGKKTALRDIDAAIPKPGAFWMERLTARISRSAKAVTSAVPTASSRKSEAGSAAAEWKTSKRKRGCSPPPALRNSSSSRRTSANTARTFTRAVCWPDFLGALKRSRASAGSG
jgi:hypothetical protein